MKSLGRQVTVDLFDCDKRILDDPLAIQKRMVEAAKAAKATVVDSLFHKFNPHGVSGVVVIAESHLAIHTWPEYGFAAVDVFTCGPEVDPRVCQQVLTKALKAKRSEYHEFMRGILDIKDLRHKPVAGTAEVHQLLKRPSKKRARHGQTVPKSPRASRGLLGKSNA